MKKPELLLPAGNFSKLKTALLFGADAVYVGAKGLSLRQPAEIPFQELKQCVRYVHMHTSKIYLAANIFPHQKEMKGIEKKLKKVLKLGFDAVIVSDPGMLSLVKKIAPKQRIHLSVQANNLNNETVNFWKKQNVKRIVLARELTIPEIKEIRKLCKGIELEVFVHGAICLSYSGRCYLSEYFTQRDANKGRCSQPCRWKYFLREEKDKSRLLAIEEDDRGVYLLNPKDLNLSKKVPELTKIGVNAFKVEGRMKSEYYVGTVGRIYRMIIDQLKLKKEWEDELKKISHREYSDSREMRFNTSKYVKNYSFVGMVDKYIDGNAVIKVRNKLSVGDKVEVLDPKQKEVRSFKLGAINPDLLSAHAGAKIKVEVPFEISAGSLLRVKVSS